MLRLGDIEYPMCLLDTMAVSEMALRPEGAFRNYLEWSMGGPAKYVPCFTIYTLIELRRKPAVFAKFIELFDPFPCLMVKGYNEILDEEVAAYPDPSGIDPCSIAFTKLGGTGNDLANLPWLLDQPEARAKEDGWNDARPLIVAGMASLVENYLPDGETYTPQELRTFVEITTFSQLVLHGYTDFASREHAAGREVIVDALPALKAMTYTVFYKFYADRNRKPRDSDAFDVMIASAFPYVEAVITEAHLAESFRKAKRQDSFLDHLRVFTLRDFRDGVPPT